MELFTVSSSPKKHLAIIWLVTAALLIFLLALSRIFDIPLWLYIFVLVFALVASAFAVVYAKTITLTLKENEVVFSRGILTRSTTTIRYNRIDNVKKIRSVFDMLLGLGTLEIDTPGKIEREIFVRNLDINDLLKVRDIISEKMKGEYDFYKTRRD